MSRGVEGVGPRGREVDPWGEGKGEGEREGRKEERMINHKHTTVFFFIDRRDTDFLLFFFISCFSELLDSSMDESLS